MGLRILIVEDNRISQVGFAAILNRYEGVAIDLAESVEEARVVVSDPSRRPDVVLLDLRLPGEPGEALFGDLSRIEPRPRVIVTTGETEPGRLARLSGLAPQATFVKPIDLTPLLAAIAGEGPALIPKGQPTPGRPVDRR